MQLQGIPTPVSRSRPGRNLLRVVGVLAAFVTGLLLAPALSAAQTPAGALEDAIVVPRGVVRMELGGSWHSWRERYDSAADGSPLSERVSLGAEFSADAYGADQHSALFLPQVALRELIGDPTLATNLGAVRTRADAVVGRTVFRMQLGLGARVAMLASVPYVQTRMSLSSDVDATAANVGLNPGLASGEALARNAAFSDAARGAANSMLALVAVCAESPGSPGCGPVDADPATAAAIAEQADEVASLLALLYGSSSGAGLEFVPIAGSSVHDAVGARVQEIATALDGYGITELAADARPTGAAPITSGQLALSDASVTGQVERFGIGDVEVGAKLLLLDTFGRLPDASRPASLALRLAVGGVFRYGRESADSVGNPLDIGIGDGQNDVEGRAWLDVGISPRVAISGMARYGVQLADEAEAALPGTFPGTVERDLGDYLEIEVSPRVALSRNLALAGVWRTRRKDVDVYSGTLQMEDGTPVDAALLGLGTETREQRVGGGIAFSTLDSYGRGLTRLPIDVSYVYTRTISGAGRLTAHSAEHRIMGRVYLRLFGNTRTR